MYICVLKICILLYLSDLDYEMKFANLSFFSEIFIKFERLQGGIKHISKH